MRGAVKPTTPDTATTHAQAKRSISLMFFGELIPRVSSPYIWAKTYRRAVDLSENTESSSTQAKEQFVMVSQLCRWRVSVICAVLLRRAWSAGESDDASRCVVFVEQRGSGGAAVRRALVWNRRPVFHIRDFLSH